MSCDTTLIEEELCINSTMCSSINHNMSIISIDCTPSEATKRILSDPIIEISPKKPKKDPVVRGIPIQIAHTDKSNLENDKFNSTRIQEIIPDHVILKERESQMLPIEVDILNVYACLLLLSKIQYLPYIRHTYFLKTAAA